MNSFLEFFSFQDPLVRKVVFGAILIAASSSMVGTFTFLRKRTLVSDAIAHAILPGICLGFMVTGQKNPFWLMLGAAFTGWLALIVIDRIISTTKLKTDTAIALVLSFFFACGAVLLSYIQHSGNPNQTGLHDFLFGKIAALTNQDLWAFGIVATILILSVVLFYKEFKVISFNPDYAKTRGLPVKALELGLSTLTVLAVAVGIQAVGIVLMSALIITPAAASRLWTSNLKKILILAAVIGMLSGIFGSFVSYNSNNMPTGPWIVVFLTVFAVFSIIFAPKTGFLDKYKQKKKNQLKIQRENLLKSMYQLTEVGKIQFTISDLLNKRDFPTHSLEKRLNKLIKNNFLTEQKSIYQLTETGQVEAKRIVRLHRLWELYLTQKMNFKSDHIHGTAETIEHIITPELEVELLKALDFPEQDPHEKQIPY